MNSKAKGKQGTPTLGEFLKWLGGHTCHWPGCDQRVPARLWGCARHWYALPKPIRDEIWRTYKPGQEITKTPSAGYIKAAKAAREWILGHCNEQQTKG